jgi:hypothetical protein
LADYDDTIALVPRNNDRHEGEVESDYEESPCTGPDRKTFLRFVIQHGKYNNRIYLLKWGDHATGGLPFDLIQKAKRCGYSKVFAKVPSNCADFFFQAGYNVEASIPRFYNGLERCFFMMYYLKRGILKSMP